ncbi:leucine-rich repeat-containing protein 47-like [Babylonia areolata]|uniref:leucine-rich repeat-containing protein 47-like n=1 Tax=Babylonia areolata TaxID=304850 RepID=UPI003FD4C4FD
MASSWPAVAVAKSEKRRELKLGKEVSKQIEEGGLDTNVYQLVNLNFLEISNTCLSVLTDELGNLRNLTNLALQGNKLETLPVEMGNLVKLKYLDLSHNCLKSLPAEIGKLVELQTLNVLMNQLSEVPDISSLKALHILNLSHNKLTSLPEGITDESLVHLSEIVVNNNVISAVPAELSNLPHLNVLNLADNQIADLPYELSECTKLKELKLSGNKIKDRKLTKFAEQNNLKQVMQYLAVALEKAAASGDKKDKKAKPKKKKKGDKDVEEVAKNTLTVLRFPANDGLVVKVESKVAAVRQYIVCCVLHNLDFNQSNNMFKNFITKQTRLHEEVCQKRQAATIATHDLDLVKGPLVYTSRPPAEIMITPLFKSKETSAADYYKSMQQEAEAQRKEKKRSTVSGVHKYLELLKDKEEFPCLLDAQGHAISFPPLTNSDKTKISKDTRHILVEVTSSVSLDMCKKVMEELVLRTLEMGVGRESSGGGAGGEEAGGAAGEEDEVVFSSEGRHLILQQVKVEDEEGGLKVIYPSRADLNGDSYHVERE